MIAHIVVSLTTLSIVLQLIDLFSGILIGGFIASLVYYQSYTISASVETSITREIVSTEENVVVKTGSKSYTFNKNDKLALTYKRPPSGKIGPRTPFHVVVRVLRVGNTRHIPLIFISKRMLDEFRTNIEGVESSGADAKWGWQNEKMYI